MKQRRFDAKHICFEANVTARKQASEAVESGVLDRLGGDRGAQLLELGHCTVLNGGRFRIAGALGKPCREFFNDETVGRKARRESACDRASKCRPITRWSLAARGIGAVDREVRKQFDQRASHGRTSQFRALLDGKTMETGAASLKLRPETARDDLAARRMFLAGEIGAAATHRCP